MLEIVLLILKIAGVIFVSVLGILIVLIGVLLFVPVRYRGDFSVSDAENGGEKAVSAKFRATWFLRLVRVYATYEKTPRVRFKLLFFTLMDTAKEKKAKRGGKSKKKRDEEKKRKAKQDTEEAAGSGDKGKTIAAEESTADKGKTTVAEKSTADTGKTVNSEEDTGAQNDTEGTEENRKEPSKKEKKSLKSRFSNILQTSRDFCDKLKGIKEKAEKIENIWTSGHMTNSRALLWRQLRYLLKHTKPKKLAGYLRFGFEDPSITGYAMAVYGILYGIWSPELSVEPDFERQVLDCHILLKGKIRVWHFARAAIRMILSRDVRRVIRDVKK